MSITPLLPTTSLKAHTNKPPQRLILRFGEKPQITIPHKRSRHMRLFKACLTCAAATATLLACDYAALKMAYKTFCILRKPPSDNTPITPWGVWTYNEDGPKATTQNQPATSKPQK